MMSRSDFRFLAIALSSFLFAGQIESAALVSESSLAVPKHTSEPIRLSLPDADAEHGTAELSKLMKIYVGGAADCCDGKMPVAGHYDAENGVLTFRPMFDFVAGQDYVVSLERRDAGNRIVRELTEFSIAPDAPLVAPEVTAVYPSGEILPENTLRFYIHFSTPMKPHVAFDYIKLVNASGAVDDAAFMKFKQELWSGDRTRLTVLMDPGRIKRGVATNMDLGPALNEGRRYKLIVEEGWLTATGTEKLDGFTKSFSVSSALRDLPSTDRWDIIAPAIHTKAPLTIRFDRPFDHQRLHQDIQVFSTGGQEIPGQFLIGNHETEWRFLPDQDWTEKRVFVVVDGRMEDVAGNNFKDLLDHSVGTETKDISQLTIAVDLDS